MVAIVQMSKAGRGNVPVQDANGMFLSMLPAIRNYLKFEFQRLDDERREEFTQAAIANCFVAFRRLVAQGRAELAYPTVLARYAASQVREGRDVGCSLNMNDVSSRYAQIKRGLLLERLDHFDEQRQVWQEAVIHDAKTPVFQQVWFRIDFPEWLRRLSARNRRIALALAKGCTTTWVARKFRLSLARISQLRRELWESWRDFHGHVPLAGQQSPAPA